MQSLKYLLRRRGFHDTERKFTDDDRVLELKAADSGTNDACLYDSLMHVTPDRKRSRTDS